LAVDRDALGRPSQLHLRPGDFGAKADLTIGQSPSTPQDIIIEQPVHLAMKRKDWMLVYGLRSPSKLDCCCGHRE